MGEELEHGPGDQSRFLGDQAVAGAGDHRRVLDVGERRLPRRGVHVEHEAVGLAEQEGGRHGGPPQAAGQLAILQLRPGPTDPRRADQTAEPPQLLLGRQVVGQGGDRLGEVAVGEQDRAHLALAADRPRRGSTEEQRRFGTRHVQPQWAHQQKAAEPLRVANGELGGQPSAEGVTDHVDLGQPEAVEEIEQMEDVVVDVVGRPAVGAGIAGMGGSQDPPVPGEGDQRWRRARRVRAPSAGRPDRGGRAPARPDPAPTTSVARPATSTVSVVTSGIVSVLIAPIRWPGARGSGPPPAPAPRERPRWRTAPCCVG